MNESTIPSHSHPSIGLLSVKTRTRFASGSRAASPRATTRSPSLSVVRVTGYFAADNWVIEPHSSPQVSVLPALSVTSILTNEWGFRQMNSLTTPSTSIWVLGS